MRLRSIFVVLLVTLALVVAPTLDAMAVQAPSPTSSLFIQTSGPNAGLSIGDYYTSPAGGDTDHLFMIRVPADWPAGTPVTVSLFDPELGGVNPVSPTAADEVRGAADSAQFRLESPTGSAVASATYTDLSTNGAWTDLATFDPGTVGTGTYLLRVRVSDDDDNSWRIDVSHDPDCIVGGPGTCPAVNLVNGNEVSRAPSGSSALAVGVIRTSWQHEGSGLICQDHIFFVNNATPRPLRAHNFDMDGSGSVTYTTPNGANVVGTVSGNASWNNSGDANRVGDVLPDINGWWTAEICISANNQYVFESPSAGPSFPEPQPAPRIAVDKTDGVGTLTLGEETTYTVTIENVSDDDPLPGSAYDLIATDVLPAGVAFVACNSTDLACSEAGGVITASLATPLEPGTSVSFDVVVRVASDAGLTITNLVDVDFRDHIGNEHETASASDVNDVDFVPTLTMSVSGPVEVLRGESASLVYTLEHGDGSDGSPVNSVGVTCGLCSTITYQSGDTNANGVLESTEAWIYAAVVPSDDLSPSAIAAEAVAGGLDANGEGVAATVVGQVNLIEPGEISGVVFEDLNGNGELDPGEVGLPGVSVQLSDGSGPVDLVTAVDGAYGFSHLHPGAYTVTPTGISSPLLATSDDSVALSLAEGETLGGVNFGFALPVTVTGKTFHDADHDGSLDPGEAGVGGVVLLMVDVDGVLVATTISTDDGAYSLTAPPGEYTVVVDTGWPTGWAMRTPAAAVAGLVLSGEHREGLDFGASNTAPVMEEGTQTINVGEAPSRLVATDGEGDLVTFTVAGGQLPAGLALEIDGTFSGTTTVGGVYQFFVEVCDQADPVACATFAYEIRVIDTEVISNEVLPFTGADSRALAFAALLLLVGGATMTFGAQAGPERTRKR
ncbi:MAG: SdrD B-like domain-containing protein [Acidimicrobiia bacterium]